VWAGQRSLATALDVPSQRKAFDSLPPEAYHHPTPHDSGGRFMVAEQAEFRASHPLQHYGILLAGIVAVSTSSILIRLADAPPLVVGTWRLLLAALFLTPFAFPRARREWGLLSRFEMLALAGSGVALAVHFAAWIYSLSLTTVASSTVLVATNPIFVGLATHYILRQPIGKSMLVAIAVTLAGSVLIGYGDVALSPRALLGDLLALAGAVAGSRVHTDVCLALLRPGQPDPAGDQPDHPSTFVGVQAPDHGHLCVAGGGSTDSGALVVQLGAGPL
jgi:hypothetical protein